MLPLCRLSDLGFKTMKPRGTVVTALLACWMLAFAGVVAAAEIRIAVASNFKTTMALLAKQFEAGHQHSVVLISGSTGKHYAQIKNGAPFDAFFAADSLRPQRLQDENAAVQGSRFTYAIGKLMLWSPTADYVDQQGAVLLNPQFRYLAVANPTLSPYGFAARQVLQALGVLEKLPGKLVQGENISQTFQFVKSGNAELGFVAKSQLLSGRVGTGSYWEIPQALYTPIAQQAVRLTDGEPVRTFMDFIKSDPALQIIQSYGYDTPAPVSGVEFH